MDTITQSIQPTPFAVDLFTSAFAQGWENIDTYALATRKALVLEIVIALHQAFDSHYPHHGLLIGINKEDSTSYRESYPSDYMYPDRYPLMDCDYRSTIYFSAQGDNDKGYALTIALTYDSEEMAHKRDTEYGDSESDHYDNRNVAVTLQVWTDATIINADCYVYCHTYTDLVDSLATVLVNPAFCKQLVSLIEPRPDKIPIAPVIQSNHYR